jgi:hypothetical protein
MFKSCLGSLRWPPNHGRDSHRTEYKSRRAKEGARRARQKKACATYKKPFYISDFFVVNQFEAFSKLQPCSVGPKKFYSGVTVVLQRCYLEHSGGTVVFP